MTRLVRYEVDLDNPPTLTEAQRDERAQLAEMRDEDIDFTDIPLTDFRTVIRFRDRHAHRRP